jgi:hypothetical protein
VGGNKSPQILAPLMRRQMPFMADWPAFPITPEITEKLMTIVYSGRVSLRGPLNKAWKWTSEALDDVRTTLPFPFSEYHSDNGSEFINESVAKRCLDERVNFTCGRSYKKTTTVSSNRKTINAFANTSDTTGSLPLANSLPWPPSPSAWSHCSTSSCPRYETPPQG